MSSGMMNTETGGEQTQYESVDIYQKPHKKSGGQLGNVETTSDPSKTREAEQERIKRGERTAENISHGQNVSESGMGGMTGGQSGQAVNDGYGKVASRDDLETVGREDRRAAGYSGTQDMDRNIGA